MTNDWDSTFADAEKIDGIAASSSPEQQLMLSNPKSTYPISLSKTVGLKAVTALGATTTRAGIHLEALPHRDDERPGGFPRQEDDQLAHAQWQAQEERKDRRIHVRDKDLPGQQVDEGDEQRSWGPRPRVIFPGRSFVNEGACLHRQKHASLFVFRTSNSPHHCQQSPRRCSSAPCTAPAPAPVLRLRRPSLQAWTHR